MIVESNIKAKVGTVSPKSDLADPHIQKLIAYIAKAKKIKPEAIENKLTKKLGEVQDLEKKAPILYHSIVKNAIEAALFSTFEETVDHLKSPESRARGAEKGDEFEGAGKLAQEKTAPEFDNVTFMKLVRVIKTENPSFFPLRNIFNRRPIISPRIIIVPSSDKEDAKKFNDITTAAATPQGEFIFNRAFMQQCMNYSHVRGIKPKGKKYKSNGGKFDDEWAMIEFLIMHEFFHYTHADFHYQKILKANPTIINWVGDFRSNYDLIKMGMEPIPIGLYNDLINYDRQNTYKEMYELVKKEMEKLSNKDQQRVQQAMDQNAGDDHGAHHGDEEPGENNTTGGGDGSVPTAEELDEHGKKVSKKAGEREETSGDPSAEGKDGKDGKGDPSAKRGGRGGVDQPQSIDWKSIKPRFKWKDLISKLVRSADQLETTYQKVHRRNITGVHVAAQTGAGVIRPGEKVVPANLVKLCLVIDSSGSMSGAIRQVFAEINTLLAESGISKTFALIEFSSSYHMYACTLSGRGAGSAREVNDIEDIERGTGGGAIELTTVMNRHMAGGTNFTADLSSKIKYLLDKKYNVLVMSDSDLLTGENYTELMSLFAHNRQQFYLILDSRETFVSFVQKIKSVLANVSHF